MSLRHPVSALIVGFAVLLLGGCGPETRPNSGDRISPTAPTSTPSSPANTPPTPTSTDSRESSQASQAETSEPIAVPEQRFDTGSGSTPNAASGKTLTTTIYKADALCETLVPTQTEVNADQPLEATVGKVITAQNLADFEIAGYRVSRSEASGEATVDFRLAPNSPRQFTSLSACEQFALFGSLEKTLTSNPQWQIQTVRFTARGEEILL